MAIEAQKVIQTSTKETSNLWVEKESVLDKEGKCYRIFKMKDGSDSGEKGLTAEQSELREKKCEKLNDELFPAVEATAKDIREFIEESSKIDGLMEDLKLLGYSFKCDENGLMEITLPSRETLLANWAKHKTNRKYPCDLKIKGADGIASDMDFVYALIHHHALLSKNTEFIHDQLSHVIQVISFILKEKEAFPEKDKVIREKIKSFYDRIDEVRKQKSEDSEHSISDVELKLLEKALGIMVDIISSRDDHETIVQEFNLFIQNLAVDVLNELAIEDKEIGEKFADDKPALLTTLRDLWLIKVPKATAHIFGHPEIHRPEAFQTELIGRPVVDPVKDIFRRRPDQEFLISDKKIFMRVKNNFGHLDVFELPYTLKEVDGKYELSIEGFEKKWELEDKAIPQEVLEEIKKKRGEAEKCLAKLQEQLKKDGVDDHELNLKGFEIGKVPIEVIYRDHWGESLRTVTRGDYIPIGRYENAKSELFKSALPKRQKIQRGYYF